MSFCHRNDICAYVIVYTTTAPTLQRFERKVKMTLLCNYACPSERWQAHLFPL
ncbi:hypothetical protein M378DRAFT_168160 [Amanita muscaria Koide BX008]|uniref:Uncharacterized protein n=1 Tax=Amanita muscaria (strain Koide BX008) TaxID=946122 RepID=A0A0C2T1T1_AMAMK|nr:hypothetical protein M378DRAFT_168160 [Amanita muscaria Koide BX008]